ncbi:hypothetical protein MMC16_001226 [Acarospora aff. strigata]|nr:hypothetical protein [Acarospora aff. strigata]
MTTNQTVGSYWFRANVEEACRSYNNGAGRSIFTYAGANVSQPNSTSSQISSCDDEGPLIPRWPTTVPQDTFSAQAQTLEVDVELPGLGKNNGDIIVWAVNMTAMNVDWEFPVLSYVYKGNTSYPDDENLISISNEAKWTYWIIQETPSSTVPIPHPIHLHGHHFFILGTGTGVWSPNNKLQFDNPPRRDSATLPGGGWLVIAFRADNPGAWLMHCHIAWHISDGLGVTFLEGIDSIAPAPADYDPTCRDWTSYYKHAAYLKIDSGL